MSIMLQFNQHGLTKLIDALRGSVDGVAIAIEATIDGSITTLRRTSPTTCSSLTIKKGDSTAMVAEPSGITWSLDADDIGTALDRLAECQSTGMFTPPEFIRVQVPKNRNLDYMYCELTETNEPKMESI